MSSVRVVFCLIAGFHLFMALHIQRRGGDASVLFAFALTFALLALRPVE